MDLSNLHTPLACVLHGNAITASPAGKGPSAHQASLSREDIKVFHCITLHARKHT